MAERAREIGAELSVDRGTAGGTQVSLRLPPSCTSLGTPAGSDDD